MKKVNTVEDYINKNELWKAELALLRSIILKTGLEETLKWGSPVYTLNTKNVLGIGAFKSYFGIWFFNGALLKDTHGVLINAQEGKTKALRQWRFKNTNEIDEELILSYINEAILNQKSGKEIKPSKNEGWLIPKELTAILNEDTHLYSAYNHLTPYKQKEYAEYIHEAKQASTKRNRLEKIKPMILSGTGLNDKYKK